MAQSIINELQKIDIILDKNNKYTNKSISDELDKKIVQKFIQNRDSQNILETYNQTYANHIYKFRKNTKLENCLKNWYQQNNIQHIPFLLTNEYKNYIYIILYGRLIKSNLNQQLLNLPRKKIYTNWKLFTKQKSNYKKRKKQLKNS